MESSNGLNITRPHVVILAAGASKAACPNGDSNGRKIPIMKDMIKHLGLSNLFQKFQAPLDNDANFEKMYSKLYSKNPEAELVKALEKTIHNYFCDLELPNTPTIYDHIILSLRSKDVIATFNWDPFLWYACKRIFDNITTDVPQLLFLHGSVAIAIDTVERKKVDASWLAENHNNRYISPKLLYPVANKNYTDNEFINEELIMHGKPL